MPLAHVATRDTAQDGDTSFKLLTKSYASTRVFFPLSIKPSIRDCREEVTRITKCRERCTQVFLIQHSILKVHMCCTFRTFPSTKCHFPCVALALHCVAEQIPIPVLIWKSGPLRRLEKILKLVIACSLGRSYYREGNTQCRYKTECARVGEGKAMISHAVLKS